MADGGTQMIKYLTMTIGKQKNIALIAHDGKKQDMLKWCMENKEILQQHNLSGIGTTARMIADYVGLKIKVVLCDARWSDAKDCSYGDCKNYTDVLGVFS